MTRSEVAARPARPEPAAGTWTPAVGFDIPAGCALRFRALGDAPFGIEVRDVDWDGPSKADVAVLEAAIRRHLLIVLRGQPSPSEPQLDEFLRCFGRLVLDTEDGRAHYAGHLNPPERPASEMAVASREYMTRAADNSGSTLYTPGAAGMSELVWHNDQSHRPMLKVLSVLEMVEMEEDVVPTEFRDTYTSAECLAPDERCRLEHKAVVYFDPRLPGPDALPRLADATHPLLVAHPHSGRRALYVNDFADRVVGTDREESDVLLTGLRARIAATAPRYVHRWQPGDIVMWDNIGLQHRRDEVPSRQRRMLRQHGGLAE